MKERLFALGTEPMPMTPQQFDLFVAEEVKAMHKLVKLANIHPQQ